MLASWRQAKRATMKGVTSRAVVGAVPLVGNAVSPTNGGGATQGNGVPVASSGELVPHAVTPEASAGESPTLGTVTPTMQQESRAAYSLHGSIARHFGDVAGVNGSATSGPVSFTVLEVDDDSGQSGKCIASWAQLRFCESTMQSPMSIVRCLKCDLRELKSIQQLPKSSRQ
jgi:hypothetical protein